MLRSSTLAVCLAVLVQALGASAARAQNVLMNSAETINQGNFKIAAFPTLLIGENGADDEWGLAGRFGYGFTPWFDVEGKVAFFEGIKLYGLDAEVWMLRGELDASVALGYHWKDLDGPFNSSAVDVAFLVSGHVSPRVEPYGGLNVSFESLDDVPESDFTRVYLVPGLEYRVSDDVDLVAEFGLGLNDDSPNYLSFGVAFYLR